MIDTIVTGHGGRLSSIKKFVITAFADVPRPGSITCYAEVCASSTEPFVMLLPQGAAVRSKHELYLDSETCKRFLSEYTTIEGVPGRHKQRVGDEILDVTPTRASISEVAPPEGHDSVTACLVTFGTDPAPGSLCGTWLVWSHSIGVRLSHLPSARYQITLKTEHAHLEHFYLFLVLPLGHDAANPVSILGSARTPLGSFRPTNPIHKFDIDPPFPVFPEWKTLIYGRQVLRTRDDVALRPFEQAALQLEARSETLQGRVTTLAYVTGLVFAVSANVTANAAFWIQDKGLSEMALYEVLAGAVLLFATGVVGWITLRKR